MEHEQAEANKFLAQLDDSQLEKIAHKVTNKLDLQKYCPYERLIEQLAEETGLSVEEVERHIP